MLQNPLSTTQPLSITRASWLSLGCTELIWPHRPCEQFLLYPVFLRLSQDLWSLFLSQLIFPSWYFSKCRDLPSPSTSCQSCWSLLCLWDHLICRKVGLPKEQERQGWGGVEGCLSHSGSQDCSKRMYNELSTCWELSKNCLISGNRKGKWQIWN